jgi:hypothetical protein
MTFLLLVLVLPVELELEAEPVAEGLQETVICPEICIYIKGNTVSPISRQCMLKAVKCGVP